MDESRRRTPLFSFLLVLVLLLLAFDPISLSVASAIGRTVEGLVGIFIAVTGWTATLIGAKFCRSTAIVELLLVRYCFNWQQWQLRPLVGFGWR